MKKVMAVYSSMSGNTKEVLDIIVGELKKSGVYVEVYNAMAGFLPSPKDFDLLMVGTYTWAVGRVPEEMKDVVAEIGYKPEKVVVFGTGDTQFGGDEFFCRGADRLAKFYNSRFDVLKVEQSPRGSQETKVVDWSSKLIDTFKLVNDVCTA